MDQPSTFEDIIDACQRACGEGAAVQIHCERGLVAMRCVSPTGPYQIERSGTNFFEALDAFWLALHEGDPG